MRTRKCTKKVFSFSDARAAARASTKNLGANPWAGLLEGSDGNFYGVTEFGGEKNLGTAFKMTAAGVLTTLVEFTGDGAINKGSRPCGTLIQGRDGNFYGTTYGNDGDEALGVPDLDDLGTVFKLTPAGVLTTLVEFTGVEGSNKGSLPGAELLLGSDGNFYGTTEFGGADDSGTVFRITPSGILTTLVEFTNTDITNKGGGPLGGLVEDSDGNFYGTTSYGGASNAGTIFKMSPSGVLITLVEFTGNGAVNKGLTPAGALVLASDGSFYGTTPGGGADDRGTVFRMSPEGMLTTLVEFTSAPGIHNGGLPYSLMLASDGHFYGTTLAGGASNQGAIFKMTPAGALTPVVEFPDFGRLRAHDPRGALVQGRDGDFYGTTAGTSTVFKMTPTGVLTTLVEFTGSGRINTGGAPIAGLVEGSDGIFYGTTAFGGVSHGTIFKMTPAGVLTTLVEFANTGPSNKAVSLSVDYCGLATATSTGQPNLAARTIVARSSR